jgi:hypothetical protein
MIRTNLSVMALIMTAGTALAAGQAEVPASAKKLDAAGIKQHYSGLHATFNNISQKASLTGEIWYDLGKGTMWGMYVWDGKNKGVFKGKNAVKGDQYCYKADGDKKETCVDVYLDGKTYYETDANKKVSSIDEILDPAAPTLPAAAKKATLAEFAAAANGKNVFITVYDMGKPIVAYGRWDMKKKRVTGEYIEAGAKKDKFMTKFTVKDDTICVGKQQDCYSYHLDGNTFYEVNADGSLHAKSVIQ